MIYISATINDHLRSILSGHGGHVRSKKLFLKNRLHFWNQHHWKPIIWYTYQYIFKVFILDLLRSSEVMEVMIRSWWGQTIFFQNLTSFLAWSSFKTYGLIYISIWLMSYHYWPPEVNFKRSWRSCKVKKNNIAKWTPFLK